MRIAAPLLGLGALTLLTALFFFSPSTVVEITKTDRGFVPETVVIDAGTTVVFTNETERDSWPASDSHPTHQLLPEFDPKTPRAPGTNWSFTFERPGVWEFHDHLDSAFTGRIVVRGEPGQTAAACLESRRGDPLTPECWEAEMVDALKDGGLTLAFSRVNELYLGEPAFRRNCHDVMHILGTAAFREFKTSNDIVTEPETVYCGYGFYHGFIEAMWVVNGMSDFSTVRTYCERTETEGSAASGPCFHGIGHAVFDSLPGTLWRDRDAMTTSALSACMSALFDTQARASCASGVFNALANAMSSGDYYLSFEGFNPDSFCSTFDPLIQEVCYGETGIGYIRNTFMDRERAITWIRSIPHMRDYLFFVYFSDETKRSMEHLSVEVLHDSCVSLDHTRDTQSCITGTVQGLREQAPAQKTYAHAFPFCSTFSGESKAFCIKEVVRGTTRQMLATPAFVEECRCAEDAGVPSVCAP